VSNRISQLPVEVLIKSDAPILARLSQLPLEILVDPTVIPPAFARISQLSIEILVLEITFTEQTQFFIVG